ncbi:MAG: maltose alpha-D-glucosyltransferase, partial [Polyangiaceae bacterium]
MKRKDRTYKSAGVADDPTWYKDAVIYELRARSYFDANDDGMGDFLGTAAKLDYLLDLGVTAIWLLPFYPSPGRDDGYDIADYMDVHPDLGTLADFEFLLAEAHKRNIRVITELVLNHTSDQHPWFQRARRAKAGSPERDFYVWSDTPDKFTDARIIFKDFESSNWSWDREANAYFWHRFYSHQPDLNFDHAPVQDALLKVVDFWLEKGVDGLRLDAVPYLYEREGTNCENLPPTHAFLKKLRAHMDSKFTGRMLLAEANQWPEDAAAYFGDGDECQMNFHFPAMPRMFMAIHMEDRLPITDIFAQTPAIPENCQWALFLRNHDELTLEMVTDEERDYMYRAYANEPSMRLNLGIRRRLAPLVGNDRHKMELLNGLLFSLPGTPVLYYGDEIGMGDNVYLGDRNGVRTPMQWSSDRNAGFSRANPQKMILPIIIDPEYHYEAINVENQQQTPTSLLWWTKRLIALRKRFTAFGRGSIEFLNPSNSKLLVFTRKFEDQIILVVANLSRFVQYAELDLSAFRGMIPVELFGKTKFPAVGDAPYMLTLSAHNFYWFSLVRPGIEAERRSLPNITAIIDSVSIDALFDADRAAIDEAIGSFIEWRSWFRGRDLGVKQVSIGHLFALARDPIPTFLALVDVEYVDAPAETYVMPLALLATDAQAGAEALIANVRIDGVTHALVDAAENSDAARALLQALSAARRIAADDVAIVISQPNSAESVDAPLTGDVTKLGPDGHHTTLRFGDRYVLTIFRKLDEAASPELDLAPFLNVGELVPKLREAVELRHARGAS